VTSTACKGSRAKRPDDYENRECDTHILYGAVERRSSLGGTVRNPTYAAMVEKFPESLGG
jgi:hypothetical protein